MRFASLVFLLQVAAGVGLLLVTRTVVHRQIEQAESARADVLRDDLLFTYARGGVPALRDAVQMRGRRMIPTDAVLLLADAQGRPLAGNLTHWPDAVTVGDRHVMVALVRSNHVAVERMWVRATSLPTGERLLTGGVIENETRVLGFLKRAAAIGLLLAVLFAGVAAWLAAWMVRRRLRGTVATLVAVRQGDLDRRVPAGPAKDAFAALTDATNQTLDRVALLVRELKIVTDSLAHDLKSPLTRQRAALERVAMLVEEKVQGDVRIALVEGERVLTIVDAALRIARAEAGIGMETFVETDLYDELQAIAEIYGPIVEEQGRVLRVAPAPAIVTPVHRELLAQSVGNLIENSLKYGAGVITLAIEADGTDVILSVADQGQGIPPAKRTLAMRRFGRLDHANANSGAGLGLALVAAVARLHDGDASLSDGKPGLIASMRLSMRTTSGGQLPI